MSFEKWKTVGSKSRSQSSIKREPPAKAATTSGIQESSGVFSQFGNLNDEQETENSGRSSTRETTGASYSLRGRSGGTANTTKNGEASVGVRKKVGSKKTKTQQERISFDECVRLLDPNVMHDFIDEAKGKFSDNPQSFLKEISGYLETSFQRAEVEKDFTFSSEQPGFPLSVLPQSCQDPLLVAVGSCPPLAQESIFRYCVDRLLGELRSGLPSYGTRIMLQLFIQSNPSTCSEATERIKLLLQSSISKVPEALSLLWVGLPHPELHPFAATALGAWPELCLPLLYSAPNVPKQVLSYAVGYTCLLFRHVGANGGPDVLRAVPPQVLSWVLTSPQLVCKKNVGNVNELFQLLQDSVLECCSSDQVSSYFSAAFKHSEEQTTQVLLDFMTNCLCISSGCFRVWERLFPRYPNSSVLLLRQLHKKLPPNVSLRHLARTLNALAARGSPEERELAQDILSQNAKAFSKVKYSDSDSSPDQASSEARGSWCSVCGVVVLVLAAVYLYVLGLFLHDLALNGPDQYLNMLKTYVDSDDVAVATDTMRRGLSGVVKFFNYYVIGSLF